MNNKVLMIGAPDAQELDSKVGYLLPGFLRALGMSIEWSSFHGGVSPKRLPKDYRAVFRDGSLTSLDSPESKDWLRKEMIFLESCISYQLPLVGICMGGIEIAKILGSEIYSHKTLEGEMGFRLISPTPGEVDFLPEPMMAYVWHKFGFSVPPGGRLLASSEFYNQAFSYGRATFALQFHPEITRKMLRAWLPLIPPHTMIFDGADPIALQLSDAKAHENHVASWFYNFVCSILSEKNSKKHN